MCALQAVKGSVETILAAKHDMENLDAMVAELDLEAVLERPVDKLSGGELQRFAIAVTTPDAPCGAPPLSAGAAAAAAAAAGAAGPGVGEVFLLVGVAPPPIPCVWGWAGCSWSALQWADCAVFAAGGLCPERRRLHDRRAVLVP